MHDDPRWIVMIEEETHKQQNGRQILPWSVAKYYADEDQARQAAWELAHTHRPQHPMSPKSRTVIHHDDYNYTVLVQGAMYAFHFRVQVGLAYPDLPGAPPQHAEDLAAWRRSGFGADGDAPPDGSPGVADPQVPPGGW